MAELRVQTLVGLPVVVGTDEALFEGELGS